MQFRTFLEKTGLVRPEVQVVIYVEGEYYDVKEFVVTSDTLIIKTEGLSK
jgi:hypothetical protein